MIMEKKFKEEITIISDELNHDIITSQEAKSRLIAILSPSVNVNKPKQDENGRNYIELFGHRITWGIGSSHGHPDYKGMSTCDIKTWFKFDNSEWFKAYGNLRSLFVLDTFMRCKNEHQLITMAELFSAKREPKQQPLPEPPKTNQ